LVRVAGIPVNFFYWDPLEGEKVDNGGGTLGFLGLEIVKVAAKVDLVGVAHAGIHRTS